MCNMDDKVINNNITFDDKNIINNELLVDNYEAEHIIFLENYTFKGNLAILTTKKHYEFKNCTIEGKLYLPDNVSKICFENCTIKQADSNLKMHGGTIEKLTIQDAEIFDKFYINTKSSSDTESICQINELEISDTIFREKFKLYNCKIDKFVMKNVDFQKDVHISECEIDKGKENDEKIIFEGINFQKNCYFYGTKFNNFLIFDKVTFGDNVDFKHTTFNKGLDISKTTIKKEMNFAKCSGLDSKESKKNTPIETYRIIKNNFLKLQNKIEANKFYSLELEKQGSLLLTWNDKAIYAAHELSSNFGRSWIRALIGILLIGFLTFLAIDYEMLFYILKCGKDIAVYGFFETLKYSYLLNRSKDFFDNHPFIFFLNKISLSYWYYQFVMATRKDTKR